MSSSAFLLSTIILFCSCTNQETAKTTPGDEKECIKKVIAVDDSLGKLRNHACEKYR